MANELAKTKIESSLKALDEVSNTFQLAKMDVQQKFTQAFALASTMNKLRTALTDDVVAQVFVPLKDTDLGFRTDEGSRNNPYSISTIRNVMIEAILRGAAPINNEVNILSGRAYFTKNFFIRKIAEYEGLTDLEVQIGIPRMLQGGAAVDAKATWKLYGKPMSLERTKENAIPVRVNAGMGADGIQGKAERKLLASIYKMLTGSVHSDGDVDDIDASILKPVGEAVVEPVTQTESTRAAVKNNTKAPSEPELKNVTPSGGEEISGADVFDAAAGSDPQEASEPAPPPPAVPTPTAPPAEKRTAGFVKGADGKMTKVTGTETTAAKPAEKPKAAAKQTKPAEQPKADPPKTEAPKTEEKQASPPAAPRQGAPERQHVRCALANVRIRARKRDDGSDEVVGYVMTDDRATKYVTKDKDLAQMAKSAMEKKLQVNIFYEQVGDDNIVIDFAVDAPPQQESDDEGDEPVESSL